MTEPSLPPPRAPLTRDGEVFCECGRPAKLVSGAVLYRRGSLAKKRYWSCNPCNAAVGCHPRTTVALGTLATRDLRAWRSAVHTAFDPLWQREGMQRGQAYAWLAELLGIKSGQCHIGWMCEAWCRRALIAIAWMRPAYREGDQLAERAAAKDAAHA